MTDKIAAVFFGLSAIIFLIAIVALPNTVALVPEFGLLSLFFGYFVGRAVAARAAK